MDRQGSPLTQQMPGAMAPRAAQPGRGMGNVPYARGMMSGNFGEKNTGGPAPLRASALPGPASAPAPPSQQPQGGAPGPAAPPPGMGAPPTPFLQPQFLFEVYAAIMDSFLKASEGDGLPWGYTY